MGGIGSGREYSWDKKTTTESMHSIDVGWMKRQNYLRPDATGTLSWTCRGKESGSISFRVEATQLVLKYRYRENSGGWEDIGQAIAFDWTPCNYGGKRQWLVCPGCGRRVALLYGGKYFLCRHCHNLSYASQQESEPFRLARKAREIRKGLGQEDELTDLFPRKPKNMHWKTYWKLREQAMRVERLSWAIMKQRYGMSTISFDL